MGRSFPLVVVILSGIAYHLAQRSARVASPWPMLAIAYGVALALTVAMAIRERETAVWPSAGTIVIGLVIGLTAIGIEAGFFFIYRAGWPLASASVISGVTVTALLATIGYFVLGEPMSTTRLTGLALATVSAICIARG